MSKRQNSGGRHRRGGKRKSCDRTIDFGGLSKKPYNASSLVKMIVTDMQPLSITQGAGFQTFMSKNSPNYEISREISSVRSDLLKLYESIKRDMKTSLRDVNEVVLTSEVWKRGLVSYQSVGCHFINHKWELKSYLLETRTLTASEIENEKIEQLQRISEEWDIKEKVYAVVMNGTTVPGLAWAHFPCFTYILDHMFNNALQNDPANKTLLTKCHKIMMFLQSSCTAFDLWDSLPPFEPAFLGEPGWNSTLNMLEYISQHQGTINKMLSDSGEGALSVNGQERSKIKRIVSALQHLKEPLNDEKHHGYITVSRIIPLVKAIENKLSKQAKDRNNEAKRLAEDFSKRFVDVDSSYQLLAATTLDPRFKDSILSHPDGIDKDKWDRLIRELLSLGKAKRLIGKSLVSQDGRPGTSRDVPVEELECRKELRRYATVEGIPITGNPLSWWRFKEKEFPNLHKAARRYLAIVSTCIPTERAFSKAGEVHRLQRLRLEPENVNMMLFLKDNFPQKA